MLTSTPEAALGRQSASQVSVVMKSGTNLLQGTAYTFFRNGALDATNYFAPKAEPDPEYQRAQSGFSIGGPIVRDRTFFFADYEGTRADEGLTRVTTVPTDAARNALPPALTHPVGRAIAALYPSPNRSTQVGNYVSSPTQRDRTDHFDVRSDTAFGGAFDLMTRYSFADRRLFEPFSGPGFSLLPGTAATSTGADRTSLRAPRTYSRELCSTKRVSDSTASPPACFHKKGAHSIAMSGCRTVDEPA